MQIIQASGTRLITTLYSVHCALCQSQKNSNEVNQWPRYLESILNSVASLVFLAKQKKKEKTKIVLMVSINRVTAASQMPNMYE